MCQTLSVVIPVFNELKLLPQVLAHVERVELPSRLERQIVLVDDCSTDGTTELLRRWTEQRPELVICFHDRNQGKGAALRTGFTKATGDIVLVQDADLEYNPEDYPRLLEPILAGEADVVYGSRFIGETHRVLHYWHFLGNKILTRVSNMFTTLYLTDMECCYKVFRKQILENVLIEENRFGFEPEVTAKIARLGVRVFETPVRYRGRGSAEGKKIGWRDGLRALWCIFRYNVLPYRRPEK